MYWLFDWNGIFCFMLDWSHTLYLNLRKYMIINIPLLLAFRSGDDRPTNASVRTRHHCLHIGLPNSAILIKSQLALKALLWKLDDTDSITPCLQRLLTLVCTSIPNLCYTLVNVYNLSGSPHCSQTITHKTLCVLHFKACTTQRYWETWALQTRPIDVLFHPRQTFTYKSELKEVTARIVWSWLLGLPRLFAHLFKHKSAAYLLFSDLFCRANWPFSVVIHCRRYWSSFERSSVSLERIYRSVFNQGSTVRSCGQRLTEV